MPHLAAGPQEMLIFGMSLHRFTESSRPHKSSHSHTWLCHVGAALKGVNCGPGHQMYKKTSAALDFKPPHVVDIEP